MKTLLLTRLSSAERVTPPLVFRAILALLFIIQSSTATAQGVVHLGPGDSYLFSNATRINQGTIEGFPRTNLLVQVGCTGDLFDPGDSYQLDAFSTPTSSTPMGTIVITNNSVNSYGVLLAPIIGPGNTGVAWISGQPGALRMTMLAGSANVNSVLADNYYISVFETFSFPVPEPNSLSLLALGAVAVIGRTRKRNG